MEGRYRVRAEMWRKGISRKMGQIPARNDSIWLGSLVVRRRNKIHGRIHKCNFGGAVWPTQAAGNYPWFLSPGGLQFGVGIRGSYLRPNLSRTYSKQNDALKDKGKKFGTRRNAHEYLRYTQLWDTCAKKHAPSSALAQLWPWVVINSLTVNSSRDWKIYKSCD